MPELSHAVEPLLLSMVAFGLQLRAGDLFEITCGGGHDKESVRIMSTFVWDEHTCGDG